MNQRDLFFPIGSGKDNKWDRPTKVRRVWACLSLQFPPHEGSSVRAVSHIAFDEALTATVAERFDSYLERIHNRQDSTRPAIAYGLGNPRRNIASATSSYC